MLDMAEPSLLICSLSRVLCHSDVKLTDTSLKAIFGFYSEEVKLKFLVKAEE